MVTERIEWIDVAKGIGIILVIAGHTFQLSWSGPIYAFHLPLFFLLSGLFAMPAYELTFSGYVKKIAKRLIIPWMVMLVLSMIVCLLIPTWRAQLTAASIIRDIYSANTNVFQNSSLWFLPCLFFALCLVRAMTVIGNKYGIWMNAGVLVVIAVSLLLILPQMKNLAHLPGGRVPFKADSSLLAFVFIASAVRIGRVEMCQAVVRLSRVWIVLALSFFALYAAYRNGWANMNSLDLGRNKFLYFPIAYLGVFAVCAWAGLISRSRRLVILKDFFAYYGKNSLLIFGFQSLFQRLYLLVANKTFDLDMQLYAANPVIHQIASFALITFVTSPIIVFGWMKIKQRYLVTMLCKG